MLLSTIRASVLSCALCVSSVAVAQSSDASWLETLSMQLLVDEACEVQFYLHLREMESEAGTIYSAKVQCKDGRRFDASRTGNAMEFTIEACTRSVC